MTRPRAFVGGLVHESSTYMVEVSGPTGLSDFDVHSGTDLVDEFVGTNTIVGGYLTACRRLGVDPVPGLHARAEPGAAVAPDAAARLRDRLVETLRTAAPVDLVLLDLHGAGALETGESLDLTVVRAVRAVVGPRVPVAVTVDLHANLPAELVTLVDVLVGFQEYPHTDMAVRAELAASLAVGQLTGAHRPVLRMQTLPMLLPPSTTWSGPGAWLRDLVRDVESEPDVRACTVLHGYPYADTPQARAAVVTVGSPAAVEAANRTVARALWENRDRFRIDPVPPGRAVATARAAARRPVVIGDGTDNPGCGAAGDSTYLLTALLDSGLRACLATIHDPDTVRACVTAGVGARVEVTLGGRHGWASGPPVRAAGTVRAITDGRVVQRSMRAGKTLDFGTSVRLALGDVDVIVASQRRQVLDPEILLLHGVVPDRYDVLAVKSVNHFRAGFAEVSDHLLVADAPGPLTREIDSLPRGPATAGLWPMDPDAVFPAVPAGQPAR
ncbi:M81 family metallopeptidase [Micromonospora sagamiensis]|uniref:Microcystin degradation protein MlrC n=1 Tax=Micromonospora sagamiensis TaxID=47875 RepID=A0A562WH15_9ACTN|nr:M81 family metallopeptidase [Micromonospora sagamiensis]TWJ29438.1 microcystin degradation protein MlrC [Micromonospora sagamiensis]BCL17533.1 microcystinase C [Micromonospora sagamiensis]